MIISVLVGYYAVAFAIVFLVVYHALQQNLRDANRMYDRIHARLLAWAELDRSRQLPLSSPVIPNSSNEPQGNSHNSPNGSFSHPAQTKVTPRED